MRREVQSGALAPSPIALPAAVESFQLGERLRDRAVRRALMLIGGTGRSIGDDDAHPPCAARSIPGLIAKGQNDWWREPHWSPRSPAFPAAGVRPDRDSQCHGDR